MKKEIKVNMIHGVLKQSELDKYIDSKYTINMTNKVSTKQMLKGRAIRLSKKNELPLLKFALSSVLMILVLVGIFLNRSPVNAHSIAIQEKAPTNAEYEYYGVDNFQDYSREIRKETCYRAWNQILWDVTEKQVKHCATLLTLQVAFETGYMTSNMCVNNKNCIWLKGYRDNWTYGFLTFDTQYDWYMMYSEKFFTYHYKKTIHTLIWGYIQKDWNYRWGWSTTDQARYVNFIRNKYNTVYDSL